MWQSEAKVDHQRPLSQPPTIIMKNTKLRDKFSALDLTLG